jgi:hypothetical protein
LYMARTLNDDETYIKGNGRPGDTLTVT